MALELSVDRPVLVTGATGFVGSHLVAALSAAGIRVRCGSRNPVRASAVAPHLDWVHFDVSDEASMRAAVSDCCAAYFLVHQVGDKNYVERESAAAEGFSRACEHAQVGGIVYLGGVMPKEGGSRHLLSRARTGEILRAGAIPTAELRTAMIIGEGSLSWRVVTDLADRLPAMLLPSWLENASWPVGIEDVVTALLESLSLDLGRSQIFDVPGHQRVTHREILSKTAAALGHRTLMVGVPVVSPRLSSYWIGLVTSVKLSLAKELVEGLVVDLDPSNPLIWDSIPATATELDEVIDLALADLSSGAELSNASRQRATAIGRRSSISAPSK